MFRTWAARNLCCLFCKALVRVTFTVQDPFEILVNAKTSLQNAQALAFHKEFVKISQWDNRRFWSPLVVFLEPMLRSPSIKRSHKLEGVHWILLSLTFWYSLHVILIHDVKMTSREPCSGEPSLVCVKSLLSCPYLISSKRIVNSLNDRWKPTLIFKIKSCMCVIRSSTLLQKAKLLCIFHLEVSSLFFSML